MSSSDSEDDYDLEYLEAESIEEKGTGRTGKRVIWANGFSYTYNSDSRKQEGVSFFHCTRQKTANRRGKRKRCKARGFVRAGQNIFFLSKRCFHDEEETNQCWNGNGGTVSNSENQIGSEISSLSIKCGAGDELLAAFPKDSSISRQIQRKKYKLNLKTVDCKKLCDMVIPPGAKVTHDEKPFLRYDSQVLSGYFATQRVLVWMSDFGHSLLLRTELVGFDATYRKPPRGIYQFFTLYAWIDEKFFVVGFAWMCGKTTESYVSVMKKFSMNLLIGTIFSNPQARPMYLPSFENDSKVGKISWPGKVLCSELKRWILLFSKLAYLPVSDVLIGYDALAKEHEMLMECGVVDAREQSKVDEWREKSAAAFPSDEALLGYLQSIQDALWYAKGNDPDVDEIQEDEDEEVRIGARTAPITYIEDGRQCFVWTKTGRTTIKDGISQGYFRCSACQAMKDGGRQAKIASLKYNLTSNEWIDEPEDYQHICKPKNVNQVIRTNARRSVQAEILLRSELQPLEASSRLKEQCTEPSARSSRQSQPMKNSYRMRTESCASVFVDQKQGPEMIKSARCYCFMEITKCSFLPLCASSSSPTLPITLSATALSYIDMGRTLVDEVERPDVAALRLKDVLNYDIKQAISFFVGLQILKNEKPCDICGASLINFVSENTREKNVAWWDKISKKNNRGDQGKKVPPRSEQSRNKASVPSLWADPSNARCTVGHCSAHGEIKVALQENVGKNRGSSEQHQHHLKHHQRSLRRRNRSILVFCGGLSRGVSEALFFPREARALPQGLGLSTEHQENEEVQKIIRMVGALQITPMVEWENCLELLRNRIQEAEVPTEVQEKLNVMLL
uniref:Uncharacterized protein n=1 Tax=Ditylenchus dipsaci TaxID=166011 RepID=A0A915DK32_9BILA